MRRSQILVAPVVAALVLTACGDPEPEGGAAPPPSPDSTVLDTSPPTSNVGEPPLLAVGGPLYERGASMVADLLGGDLATFQQDVESAGLGPVRIAWEDGDYLDLTDDLVPGRVNVAVQYEGDVPLVIDAFVETADGPDTTGDPGPTEAAIVSTTEAVEYYPACGNERLEFDGVTWYIIGYPDVGPVDEMFADRWDELAATPREPSPVFGPSGFVRVVEPGPGDDVGTLVVWADGVARWVSDSGDLDVWLVDEDVEVLWDC